MTDQNNAAQPVLTDDEIFAALRPLYADAVAAQMGAGDDLSTARAIESALLSKLRAEGVQAGDERADFEDWILTSNVKSHIGYSTDELTLARAAWDERARRAALASAPVALSPVERNAITGLIAVARAAFNVADDSEDDGGHVKVDRADAEALGAALDALEELPDDQPGYAMGPSNKAEWALRRVLDVASAPVAGVAQQNDETLRLVGVIADKIEDGTLFNAGIYSRRDLADKVRAVLRLARQGVHPAAPQASEAVCSCPTGDGSLRHPCAVHPPGDKDGGHGSDTAPPQSPPDNRTEALHG
jgi:hypothetical protein